MAALRETKFMGSGQLVRSAARILLIALATGLFLLSCRNSILSKSERDQSREHAEGPHMLEALQRERYQASRHGVQFGVPKGAYPRAMAQVHAMERALAARG